MSDIDGLGAVILAKLAFKNVDYVLCETLNLPAKITEKILDCSIYQYDQIFITDMWLEDPQIIANNPWLSTHTLLFDHHESALKVSNIQNYKFMTIKIKNKKGRCSGTSLFYEYLASTNKLLANCALERFVELTRLYDTWEWVTVTNEPEAKDLTTLFNVVGPDNYASMLIQKLQANVENFEFTPFEENLIQTKNKQNQEKIEQYARQIYIRNIAGLQAGIAFIDFSLQNEFAQYLRDINYPIDFIMMISLENGVITYRYVTQGIKVLDIAESYGGKGHDYAASSPIRKRKMNSLIDEILKK